MKYFFKYNKINNELYLAIKKSKNKNGTTFIISLSCNKLIWEYLLKKLLSILYYSI